MECRPRPRAWAASRERRLTSLLTQLRLFPGRSGVIGCARIAPPSEKNKEPFSGFRWLASLGIARPWWVLAVVAALSLAAGASTYGIRISTSCYALVSAKHNAYRARLLGFFERFGIQLYEGDSARVGFFDVLQFAEAPQMRLP